MKMERFENIRKTWKESPGGCFEVGQDGLELLEDAVLLADEILYVLSGTLKLRRDLDDELVRRVSLEVLPRSKIYLRFI